MTRDGASAVNWANWGETEVRPSLPFSTRAEGSIEMDLRQYYKKLHELEAKMTEAHVLVVSVETGDGGREGVITEVARRNACQLILEGRARRADQNESDDFRYAELVKRDEYQSAKTASRMQFQMVPIETGRPTPAKSEE